MKRAICLIAVLLLFLCGCSQNDHCSELDVVAFSYETDFAYYKDAPGVKQTGFVNAKKSELNSTEQAVELAKNECTVKYDTISMAFDSDSKIYRVSFYKEGWAGGNQDVYINQEGITQLIIYGE